MPTHTINSVPPPTKCSLLATGVCLAFRKESAASVGWQLDRRWAGEFAVGTLLGVGLMVLATGLLWSSGAVTWELDPGRSFRAGSMGLVTFTLVAFWEENLFRGFVFQRLLDGMGVWPTQAILALLFALSHWSNPGMQGVTKFWASLNEAATRRGTVVQAARSKKTASAEG